MKKYFILPLLPLVITLMTGFFFYRSTLLYYFVGDDFPHISFSSLPDILVFGINRYHFNPFFWLMMWLLRFNFGLNPVIYHLTAIILHLGNVVLVYLLAKKMLVSYRKAFAVTLLYTFFFSHYEVVYWITGITTSLMVFFYLAGLIAFITFVREKKIWFYLGYVFLFSLTLFSHEYGITLPLVCSIYWLVYAKSEHKLQSLIPLNGLPLIATVSLLYLKMSLSNVPLMAFYPGFFQIGASILKSSMYLFLPIPQLYDNLPKLFWVFIGSGLIWFVMRNLRNRLQLFLFLWFITVVGCYSITSLTQARYFYLASIPAILLMVSILASATRLFIPYFLLTLVGGLLFLEQQKSYWTVSSRIVKSTLAEIVRIYPQPDFSKTHYFINLPDNSNASQWPAYIYRSGIDWALFLEYGKRPKVEYYNINPKHFFPRLAPEISSAQLKKIVDDGQPVFIYNPQSEKIEWLTNTK